MPEKFRNKYRIQSARHPYWDYGQNAAYFITICTRNREPFFGYIENHEMVKSKLGEHAHECWQAIPQHFPFVRLGAFVVMPNHVHGIIIINHDDIVGGTGPNVETQNIASLQLPQQPLLSNRFGPQSQNLASVVRGYKIGVTKMARYGVENPNDGETEIDGNNGRDASGRDAKFCVSTGTDIPRRNIPTIWQPRYHDHIIRNADEYNRIETYIVNNPVNWVDDKFYHQP